SVVQYLARCGVHIAPTADTGAQRFHSGVLRGAHGGVDLHQLRLRLANTERARRVGAVAVHDHAEVNEDRLARAQVTVGRLPVWQRATWPRADDGGKARSL